MTKLLHLKFIHGFFGLPQHIICTHPDQDMKHSAIHLHYQGLLSGILSLLTSKTHQMSNSLYLRWPENLSHDCIMQCYTDYRKYTMYTKYVNSMSWLYMYILSDCVHVYRYLAFAAQSYYHVLWNCIFHTSLTLDLVLRPKYSFIVHAYFIQLVTITCIHSFTVAFSLPFIHFLL